MFVCEGCGENQPDRSKPIRRVAEKRDKEYPDGSKGWEIVKEISLCVPCATK